MRLRIGKIRDNDRVDFTGVFDCREDRQADEHFLIKAGVDDADDGDVGVGGT